MSDAYALLGRHKLDHVNRLTSFKVSIMLRINEACKAMDLSPDSINLVCFSSMSKESFMVYSNSKSSIYFDIHQIDSLNMLASLFYYFGKYPLKATLFLPMYDQFPYIKKRLAFSLLILQAEKCFLCKDLSQADAYLKASTHFDYTNDLHWWKDEKDLSPTQDFLRNLVLLNSDAQNRFINYTLSFLVFHELAHVKYQTDKQSIESVITSVDSIIQIFFSSNPDVKVTIPIEEYICDAYALYTLFEYLYRHLGDYDFENVITSYYMSALNVALINSKETEDALISDIEYTEASTRAIISIASLCNIWASEKKEPKLSHSLIKAMEYTSAQFSMFKNTLQAAWAVLYSKYHVDNRASLTYDEEKNMISSLLSRFSNVK